MSRDGWKVISIHRSLAGPDLLRLAHFHVLGISIHRSLAGPDSGHTPPGCRTSDFNPQVPCGTRRRNGKDRQTRPYFNPQVPCGTRLSCRRTTSRTPRFQSTGPLRDPTVPGAARGHPDHISIHRSLAGPDMDYSLQHTYRLRFQSTGPLRDPTGTGRTRPSWTSNFNPQVPCGTRLPHKVIYICTIYFNPQVPCGTRPPALLPATQCYSISIHRSLAGPDFMSYP